MNHLRSFTLGSFLLGLTAAASAQNTWYVDAGAVPPGSGTQSAPYASIQYAIDRPTTLNGDTILVAPGLYVENVVDDHYSKYVIVRSTQGPLATELRPQNPGLATVFYVNGSTIDGFTLTGNSSVGINGGALNLEASFATRCIVRNNPGLGLFSYAANVRGCTFVDNGSGIFAETFAGVSLRNTIVTGSFPQGGAGTIFADYCAGNLPAGTIGVGNVAGNPGLWTIAGSRHRLRPDSPCIDAGDPSSPLDPDGSRADIGAVPFDATFSPTATYCAGKPNSQGCVPAIGGVGTASASSGAPFLVSATNEVPNKVGVLLLSLAAGSQPFQGGTLCLTAPIQRLGLQTAGGTLPCTGTYAFDVGAYTSSGANPGLVPGAHAFCQWWSRDKLDPAGFASGLSNALVFGVAP